MFKTKLLSAAVVAVALVGCGEEQSSETTDVQLETLEQRASYIMGRQYGEQLSGGDQFQIDHAVLMAGVREGLEGTESRMSEEQITATITEFQERMQVLEAEAMEAAEAELAQVSAENEAEGLAFLEQNATREGVITTESGLQYEVIAEGEGASPSSEAIVTVNYTGTLIDGTVFDSTDLHGEPASFPLNRVIQGWTEGVGLMKVGSVHKLYIPYALAYGEMGSGSIPPKATLIFEVELLDIEEQ